MLEQHLKKPDRDQEHNLFTNSRSALAEYRIGATSSRPSPKRTAVEVELKFAAPQAPQKSPKPEKATVLMTKSDTGYFVEDIQFPKTSLRKILKQP